MLFAAWIWGSEMNTAILPLFTGYAQLSKASFCLHPHSVAQREEAPIGSCKDMNSDWPIPASGWDVASLTSLFASDPEELGDVDVNVEPGSDVLRITLKERGDLDVLMVASGEQILCSVLLTAADAVPARPEFEHRVLSVHKLIPLSNFGITQFDGAEWYELFGALSSHSNAAALIEEVAVLAANAVDAAEWIGEWIEAGGEPA